MPRRARRARVQRKSEANKSNITLGTIAFILIFLLAYAGLFTVSESTHAVILLLLAILGAVVAIFNITLIEEANFLIALTALNVIFLVWHQMLKLSPLAKLFLLHLTVAFGTAGFIIAFAMIIQLCYRP